MSETAIDLVIISFLCFAIYFHQHNIIKNVEVPQMLNTTKVSGRPLHSDEMVVETLWAIPLNDESQKCSDWAKNVATDSSKYSKNLPFCSFIYNPTLLKSYYSKCVFNFDNFLTVHYYKFFSCNSNF